MNENVKRYLFSFNFIPLGFKRFYWSVEQKNNDEEVKIQITAIFGKAELIDIFNSSSHDMFAARWMKSLIFSNWNIFFTIKMFIRTVL